MTTEEVFDKLLHGRTLEQINITCETKHIYDNVSNCYEVSDKKSGDLLFYVDEMRSNYSYTTDCYGRRVYSSYSFYDFVDPSWTKNTYNSVWAEELYDKVDKIYKKLREEIKELKVKTKAHKNVKNAVHPPYRLTLAQKLLRLRKINKR